MSRASQNQVVHPLLVLGLRDGSPLATATLPSGTVISYSYVALSVGWSLDGNQVMFPSGSPTTMAPSRVVTQPYSAPSMSVGRVVSPAYSTTTVARFPFLSSFVGWIVSSQIRAASSCTCQYAPPRTFSPAAGAATSRERLPLTLTDSTSMPRRSRLKRSRSSVAVSLIFATPSR